jgi:hypothetical protein
MSSFLGFPRRWRRASAHWTRFGGTAEPIWIHATSDKAPGFGRVVLAPQVAVH